MTSSFTLAHTDIFYDSPVDLYENEEHEIFMTALQLSNCLEYESKANFKRFLNRHQNLRNEEFSRIVALSIAGYALGMKMLGKHFKPAGVA